MSHLSLEDLARLLDEEPSESEAAHLEGCTLCQGELAALGADREGLGNLPDLLPPPPNSWTNLAERLRAEGLIRGETRHETAPEPVRATAGRPFLRLAAALALFLLGGGTGYLIRTMDDASRSGTDGVVAHGPAGDATKSPAAGAAGGETGEEIDAAALALQEAEVVFRSALTRYNDLALGERTDDDRLSRLAELIESTLAPEAASTSSEVGARYIAGITATELNPDLARYFADATQGALILRVVPGTPAAVGGLVAGDVVTAVAGTQVRTMVALRAALDQATGRVVDLEVIRQGERLQLQLRP